MKTGKELLMLAAKAVGYNVKAVSVDIDDNFDGLVIGAKNTKQKVWWNPLLNDGDALRLAVDLGINVAHEPRWCVTAYKYESHKHEQGYDGDKHAATRRAIVRSAAAIGEGME